MKTIAELEVMQKKLRRMTSMEQIDYIAVEARKSGMKYGEFTEKYGEWSPAPKQIQLKPKKRDTAEHKKRKDNPQVETVCQECGKTYVAAISGSKYCPECRDIVRKRRAKEKREERRRNNPATCKKCGKLFIKTGNRQLYCEDCKAEAALLQRREYQRQRRRNARSAET